MLLRDCLFLPLTFFTLQASAQTSDAKYDQRVKSRLDGIGLKYSITEKGNFKVVFDVGKNRTQVVIVNSTTYQYEGLEIREIYSAAASVKDKASLSQKNLFILLERNETYKIGSWQIANVSDVYRLEYALRISADTKQSELDELLRLAARTADDMETQLTDGDEF